MAPVNRRALLRRVAATAVVTGGSLVLGACGLVPTGRSRVPSIAYFGNLPWDQPETGIALREGLREAGWVEGENLRIEWRFTTGTEDWLQEAAFELVRSGVDLVMVDFTPVTRAIMHASSSMPIVHPIMVDPVANGYAASMAQPGGQVTGVAGGHPSVLTKRMELLQQLVPGLARVGYLWNSASPTFQRVFLDLQALAQALGLDLRSIEFRTSQEVDGALESIAAHQLDALVVQLDPVALARRQDIVQFLAHSRLPALVPNRSWTEVGRLIAYGTNIAGLFRRSAFYVDRILRGAKPGDLPIEYPTRMDLIVNLTTAEALGLTIPEELGLQVTEWVR